jgi:hypothetical protein
MHWSDVANLNKPDQPAFYPSARSGKHPRLVESLRWDPPRACGTFPSKRLEKRINRVGTHDKWRMSLINQEHSAIPLCGKLTHVRKGLPESSYVPERGAISYQILEFPSLTVFLTKCLPIEIDRVEHWTNSLPTSLSMALHRWKLNPSVKSAMKIGHCNGNPTFCRAFLAPGHEPFVMFIAPQVPSAPIFHIPYPNNIRVLQIQQRVCQEQLFRFINSIFFNVQRFALPMPNSR